MPKPSKDISELIQLLRDRGLSLDDSEQLTLQRFLLDVNYYRASGYWRYFQKAPHLGDNDFHAGLRLSSILDVYEFDHGLRNILLEGLSVFEIAFRSRFAYFFAQHLEEHSYLDRGIYTDSLVPTDDGDRSLVDQIMESLVSEIRRSKEPYIVRHREAQTRPPVWVVVEAVSMGTVSKMYKGLSNDDVRYAVSKSFGFPDPHIAESTFRSFTVLRNICAHHARLWNRVPQYPHPVLNQLKVDPDSGIYHRTPWSWIVSLTHLVDKINRNDHYSKDVEAYLNRYPEFLVGLKYPHNR